MAQDRQTAGMDVYQAIYELLLKGEFKPGDRLTETKLAERFGISRTPVREALNRLEHQKLLQHQPYRGMVVRTLDHQAVTELYVMREVLEGTAAALAARHATDAEISVMKDIVARDRKHTADSSSLAQSNKLFHESVQRAAHNRYIVQALNSLAESMALLGPTSLAVAGRVEEALDQHEQIVTAIENHDPQAAEKAARAHIQGSHRARLILMLERDLDPNLQQQLPVKGLSNT